jgi:uncharacterized protein (DUF1800 family)
MGRVGRLLRVGLSGGRVALVGALCGGMVVPSALAQGVSGARLPVDRHLKPLTSEERVLQALNRFTFGPRPGDVASVERMGLQRWFEMQLHPERIEDSGFGVELGEFPAMGLAEDQLRVRFPSGQMIRQMSKQGGSVPSDPVERAIYADSEAVYEAKVKTDAVGGGGAVGAQAVVAGPTRPQGARTDGAPASVVGTQGSVAGSMHDGGAVMNGAHGSVAGSGVGLPNGEQGLNGRLLPQTIPHPAAQRARVEDGPPGMSPVSFGMDGITGFSPEQVEGVLRLGVEERFGRLVGMGPEEMLGFREAVKGRDRVRLVAGMSAAQREAVEAMVESPERVVATEVAETRLLRDIDSKRQLQAVMTEFWLNHFNVYLHKNEQEPYLLPEYEQEAILPHALGRFEDLLVATAESPAMLMYLDNWESVGPESSYADGGRLRGVGPRAVVAGPTHDDKAVMNGAPGMVANVKGKLPKGINENYGRELMELHTLGVGGGYTQQDVIEVAKCFTGWTIDRPYGGGGKGQMMDSVAPGQFVFDPKRHEPGAKVVLGHTIPEGGMKEGLEVLHILATSPATARFISQELAVRFVSDNPPPALVKRMAASYLKSDGNIGAVLTTMFKAKEFWSPQVYRAKVKTPLEFLVSAVRASDATVTNPLPLVQAMDRLGMPVWGMQTPNGYGWTAEDWVSSNGLISRMNFALVLSGNKVQGTKTDWEGMVGADASAAAERELEGDLLGQPASERTREAVMAEFGNPTAQQQAAVSFNAGTGMGGGLMRTAVVRPVKASEVPLDTMAGLLMGSPEFQRR